MSPAHFREEPKQYYGDAMKTAKIIYDFGSNNGDDIPYYLKKADIVVAVEANPALCEEIRNRFGAEILRGQLILENVVLTDRETNENVPFYLSKEHHVLGQFPRPSDEFIGQYEEVLLPSKSALAIIKEHGFPYYVKVDIEHYDEVILRELFLNDIRPPYISAESHTIVVFCMLVGLGGYRSFKLVDGGGVSKEYANHLISTIQNGMEKYSFPMHSAGPFGDDIRGEWFTADNFFHLLIGEDIGWKDIHATNTVVARVDNVPKLSTFKTVETIVRHVIKPRVPKNVWEQCKKLYRLFR